MSLRAAFWAVFTLGLAVYLTMVFWSLPIISGDAGGQMPFDLRPWGYTTDEARSFLAALGETGRAHYLGPQHWLDTFYPGLLAVSLILAYFLLFPNRWALGFSLIAVLAAAFDWSENSAVADLLKLGAERVDDEVVGIAALMTILKSATVTLALTLLLAGLAQVLWLRRKGRA